MAESILEDFTNYVLDRLPPSSMNSGKFRTDFNQDLAQHILDFFRDHQSDGCITAGGFRIICDNLSAYLSQEREFQKTMPPDIIISRRLGLLSKASSIIMHQKFRDMVTLDNDERAAKPYDADLISSQAIAHDQQEKIGDLPLAYMVTIMDGRGSMPASLSGRQQQTRRYVEKNTGQPPSTSRFLFFLAIIAVGMAFIVPQIRKTMDARQQTVGTNNNQPPRRSATEGRNSAPQSAPARSRQEPFLLSPGSTPITATQNSLNITPAPIPEIADNWTPSTSTRVEPPVPQSALQPSPQGKNVFQFAINGVPIAIPMPVNYVANPDFIGETMEIDGLKGTGRAMYEKFYENGMVLSGYSVFSFDILDNITATTSHFQEYKTGVKSRVAEEMRKTYAAANQMYGEPSIAVASRPEIFIDEERVIGEYHTNAAMLDSLPVSQYTSTLTLLINGKIVTIAYSATTPNPKENYPDVVKNTARKWVDAILAANKE